MPTPDPPRAPRPPLWLALALTLLLAAPGARAQRADADARARRGAPPSLGPCRVIGSAELQPARAEDCPASVVTAVRRWRPDVLVALGGGLHADGSPTCSTAQRAWATHRLYERLRRHVSIILAGRGPARTVQSIDGVQRTCLFRRMASDVQERRLSPEEFRRQREQIRRTRRAVLGEAEQMCAEILRRYPVAEHGAVVATMYLESRSMSTAQNAQNVTAMIRRLRFRRALVVTSGAMRDGVCIDDHARRSAADFRRARAATDSHRVAAVACPYTQGPPAETVLDE